MKFLKLSNDGGEFYINPDYIVSMKSIEVKPKEEKGAAKASDKDPKAEPKQMTLLYMVHYPKKELFVNEPIEQIDAQLLRIREIKLIL